MYFNLKNVAVVATVACFSLPVGAQHADLFEDYGSQGQIPHVHPDRSEVTFYQDAYRLPDLSFQQVLRNEAPWQNFLQQNGDWWVQFNEENRLPQRAMGKPIAVSGANKQAVAMNFITQHLTDFNIPVGELVAMPESHSRSHTWVRYKQEHNGHEILGSEMVVKITPDNKVIMFGAKVYPEISLPTTNVSPTQAETYAMQGINNLTGIQIEVESGMKILPVPTDGGHFFRYVYEVRISGDDTDGLPARYYALVDATHGGVLYRYDEIMHSGELKKGDGKAMPASNIEVDLEATVYTTHSYDPSTVEKLPNLNVNSAAGQVLTDGNGYVDTGLPGPGSVTFELAGDWSTVYTNNVTPTFTATLNPGMNTVTFDNDANIRELSAYRSVNVIHDHLKNWIPSFTGMDFSLPTNIDVAGSCNAFYNGSSINFYAVGGGCLSYATVADVVYHEYGHGINDNFYSSFGSSFSNGAMNEGYADWWAISITLNPILGVGGDDTDPTAFIRRYDIDPKAYPDDIVSEVHADGEIIAGAWWDTYLELGSNFNTTMQLFVDAFPGLQANTFNGDEGSAYTSVLIDVLQADDVPSNGGDNDITNGTPNGNEIVTAFAIHGITLISNGQLTHTDILSANASAPIDVQADLTLNFPFTNYLQGVMLNYSLNNSGTWSQVAMTNTSGTTYDGQIPAQPIGTLVKYYVSSVDINNQTAAVEPVAADVPVDPNVPYYILVGMDMTGEDDVGDFNQTFGAWTIGVPDDNATTGMWTATIPLGSYQTPGDPNTIVQTDDDHTPGGDICFVTGNASTTSDGIGTADVDGGKTTLETPTFDLSAYTNPVFTYWKWYTNNPPGGANPSADWWQVYLSNDNGSTWIPVEDTKTGERKWRRNAFRVQDYLSPSAQVKMRFVASDSIRPGQNLDGGSLIEAALDDIRLWENEDVSGIDDPVLGDMNIYPNPASDVINITYTLSEASDVVIEMFDAEGRKVYGQNIGDQGTGEQRWVIDQDGLASGYYNVRITTGENAMTRKVQVLK